MVKGLTIESVLTFGVNKGYTLGEVFLYFPDYVEWIMHKHGFYFIDDPRKLVATINPTPFHGNEVFEKLLEKYPSLKSQCRGVSFKFNSLAYAKAVLTEFNISLDTFDVTYSKAMKSAKHFYEIDKELHESDPETYPAPEKIHIWEESVFFDFSEQAYAVNEVKRAKFKSETVFL